jgi:hypothetical protein
MEKVAMHWLLEFHLDEVPDVFSVVVCCQEVSQDVLWNWCLALFMISSGWIFALYRWCELCTHIGLNGAFRSVVCTPLAVKVKLVFLVQGCL